MICFDMILFDNDVVREKLTVMDPIEAMFDDQYNEVPEEYWDLVENLQPGEGIRITMEKIYEN